MKINQDVLAVLSTCATQGNQLQITRQLDRKLYERVNEVLEAAGGKWNRKAKAHIFEGDVEGIIDGILLTGEIDKPKDFGFFPTPKNIVQQLIELADIRPGMIVLEPSAGTGNIAEEVAKITTVHCVELLRTNTDKLFESHLYECIAQIDFLKMSPAGQKYDRIVMNPPFEKQADIDHVRHADKFLKPSGRLVSVMSAGILFRENKKTVELRQCVNARSGRFIRLPEGAFKESGTMINTCIVVLPGLGAPID